MPPMQEHAALWADLEAVLIKHRPSIAEVADQFKVAELVGLHLGYAFCAAPRNTLHALQGFGAAVGEWVVKANPDRPDKSINSALDVTLEYVETGMMTARDPQRKKGRS